MRLILTTLLLMLLLPSAAYAVDIEICGNEAGFPPYYYHPKENGKIDQSKVTGPASDLRREVFKMLGMSTKTTLLPWKRCLRMGKAFSENQKFEVIADSTFNNSRAEGFYFSAPMYKTTIGIFYSKNKYPEGVRVTATGKKVKTIRDLAEHKICGVLGWNYDIYYTKFNLPREIKIDTNGTDLNTLLQMTARGRCDLFESGLEQINGGEKIGVFNIPDEIESMPLEDVEGATFYMMVPKSSPRAHELVNRINQALIKLKQSGKTEEIFNRYGLKVNL